MLTQKDDTIILSSVYSSLAQLVEHAAVNRRVVGSSPTGGAMKRLENTMFSSLFLRLRRITLYIFYGLFPIVRLRIFVALPNDC